MSTFKDPVGPQSRATYWRRRLFVGVGLVAVVVVIVLIVVRPGSGGDDAGPASTSSQSASTSATDGAGEGSGGSGDGIPAVERTAIPTSAADEDGDPCRPKNVEVKAITDADSYGPDEKPKLSLSVTNTGSTDCVINAGTSEQIYTVTSGKELYWKSTDCQTKAVDTKILLKAHQTLSSQPITWDRTRSSANTCDDDRDPVPADGASYHLTVSLGGIESDGSKQFLLH